MRKIFAVALLTITVLCVCVIAQENTAEGWYEKGRELYRNGSYEEAVKAYDRAIELNPRYIDAWLSRGYALDDLALEYGLNDPQNFTNTLDDAILSRNKVIEIDPYNSKAWSDKGFALGLMGPLNHSAYNESIAAYDKAIELNPNNAEIWMEKGLLLSRLAGSTRNNSRYEDALEAYDQAAILNPQQGNIRLLKANALLNLGRYNESLSTLDEAVRVASENSEKAQVWFEKAHLFAEQGDYSETVKALEKATELAPQDKDLWINGGVLLSAVLGEYNEAIKYYEKALQIDPADGYAWNAKGEALKMLGRVAEADVAYAKANELGYQISNVSPVDTAEFWYQKGQEMGRKGAYNESIQAYYNALNLTNETLEENPSDAAAWQTKGLVLEKLYRIDEAAIAFDKAIELHPENAYTWLHKGKALDLIANRLQGQDCKKAFEDAIRAYDKAIELDPSYGEAWMGKGYSLHSLAAFNKNLSEYNESLKAFDKAIELIPANDTENLALAWDGRAIGLTGMGNTFDDMGMKEEAKSRWEEALSDCSKAIELDQNFTGLEAQLYSAGILAALGRYNESLAAYDSAIATRPGFSPGDNPMYVALILTDKGGVLDKIGKYEDSLKAFDEAIELFPENAAAWNGQGNVLNSTGRYEEAVESYEKAIELAAEPGPLSAYSWQGKGMALKALGRISEADAAFARARELGYQ